MITGYTEHKSIKPFEAKQRSVVRRGSRGGEMGEFSPPPLFLSPLLSFFLIPQILIGSNTLLQKFTPHFKILDPPVVY